MHEDPTPAAHLPVGPRLVAAHWNSLWITGDPTALEPPLVAIVGTREADAHGLALARDFAAELARQGVGVLSGGALGIDAAAHGGALDAAGRTAVVLPSGFAHPYPLRHAPLYEAVVAAGGALVSPFPPDTPPARWTFPRRNALLAALCDLLLVVQAPPASGSLITAEAARKLGRRVLVVPASPGDPRGGGCLRLLRLGAEVCAAPSDVLAALAHRDGPLSAFASTREPLREAPPRARVRHARAHSRGAHAHARDAHARDAHARDAHARDAHARDAHATTGTWALDDDSRVVYESLATEPRHIDEVAHVTALPAARVRTALLSLVLMGLAADRGDGTHVRLG